MENNFNKRLSQWLQEVADGCHAIATNPNYDMDLDFYVFQSGVQFQPELMIIGSNPGRLVRYSEMNAIMKRERRLAGELGYESNQFLANDGWGTMRSLCDLFSGAILRPVFEEAVLTNIVYFNTGSYKELQKRVKRGGREALAFCVKKSMELIREIVQPRRLLLLGNPACENLMPYFDHPLKRSLGTPREGWNLIQETTLSGIPVYCIHHPSAMNKKFNTGENQKYKRIMFETIFSK